MLNQLSENKVEHRKAKPRLIFGNKEIERLVLTMDEDELVVEAAYYNGRLTLSSCPRQEALLFTEGLMSGYDVQVDASQLKGVPLAAAVRKKAHTDRGTICYAEGAFLLGDANEAYEWVGRAATAGPGVIGIRDGMKSLEVRPLYIHKGVKKHEENLAWITLLYRVATAQIPSDLSPEGVCPQCFSRFFIIESGQCQECHYARF